MRVVMRSTLRRIFFGIRLSAYTVMISVNAQVKTTIGPVAPNSSDIYFREIAGCDTSGFYVRRTNDKVKCSEKYNRQSLLPVQTFTVDLGQNAKFNTVCKMVSAQGKLFIFRMEHLKKSKDFVYYMQTCAADGHALSPEVEIFTATTDKNYEPTLNSVLSPTGKRLLVNIRFYNEAEGNYSNGLVVVNTAESKKESVTQLNAIRKETLFYLDDEGSIYFILPEENENPLGKENKSTSYRFTLKSIRVGKSGVQNMNLTFNDNCTLFNNKCCMLDGKFLIIGGFYRKDAEDKKDAAYVYGIYSFKIDLQLNMIVQKQMKTIDAALITPFNKKDEDVQNIKLDTLMLVGNDLYFAGQQFSYGHIKQVGNFGFKFGDALIVKMDREGNFTKAWSVPMRSTQIGSSEPRRNFLSIVTDKQMYIVHFDLEKNFKKYEEGNYNGMEIEPVIGNLSQNTVVHALSLKGTEVTDYKVLLRNSSKLAIYYFEDYVLDPKTRDLFIRCHSGDYDQFAKFSFD